MAEQVVTDGATLTTVNGVELVCVAVRYEEDPLTFTRSNHQYIFRSVDEMNEEKAAAEQKQREEEEAARAAEENMTTETHQEGTADNDQEATPAA